MPIRFAIAALVSCLVCSLGCAQDAEKRVLVTAIGNHINPILKDMNIDKGVLSTKDPRHAALLLMRLDKALHQVKAELSNESRFQFQPKPIASEASPGVVFDSLTSALSITSSVSFFVSELQTKDSESRKYIVVLGTSDSSLHSAFQQGIDLPRDCIRQGIVGSTPGIAMSDRARGGYVIKSGGYFNPKTAAEWTKLVERSIIKHVNDPKMDWNYDGITSQPDGTKEKLKVDTSKEYQVTVSTPPKPIYSTKLSDFYAIAICRVTRREPGDTRWGGDLFYDSWAQVWEYNKSKDKRVFVGNLGNVQTGVGTVDQKTGKTLDQVEAAARSLGYEGIIKSEGLPPESYKWMLTATERLGLALDTDYGNTRSVNAYKLRELFGR